MLSFEPTEEQKLMRDSVGDFARATLGAHAREHEAMRGVPDAVRRAAFELGLGTMDLPEDAGGQGLGLVTTVLLEEELGRADAAAAFALAGPGAFGTAVAELAPPLERAALLAPFASGFSVGKIEDKMGLRASETAELVLDDCRVPEDNLLGGADAHAGKEGFMTAMKTFDTTRPLVGAMACGIGRAAYEHARDFVRERYLLSRPIPRYAALAERLARVGRRLEAARALVHHAVYLADLEQPNAKEASMAKAYAGQAAVYACTEAIDICGAHGTLAGSDQLLEKWFRDIKVFDIFEGTGNIQRVVIAKRIVSGLKAF
ncbi:MAG: acyl-CoA dehydrogenase family protein [Myxococcales bacterium]|nr:acyl-CoA dehydrogenase family protein [Myxococcales bacterium]